MISLIESTVARYAAIAEYFDLELALDGTYYHHRLIYDALLSRDGDRACEAMGNHIRSIIKKVNERTHQNE